MSFWININFKNTKNGKILRFKAKESQRTLVVGECQTQEQVDRMLDEQASRTTAEMMEKFKDYKSREEIKSLLFKFTNHFDLKRNIEITLDMQSKWLEENL